MSDDRRLVKPRTVKAVSWAGLDLRADYIIKPFQPNLDPSKIAMQPNHGAVHELFSIFNLS
jgi:hypothetical protein